MGKKIIFSVVLGLLIFSFSIAFSFAWFAISESFFPDVSGDSVTGYFKDGDGSPDDPYIIETPTHVYNLAWLQYIGLLNQETTDSEGNPIITQYYFKISDEIDVIDMDGVVIPPIGTKDKPFVGHFDGNGKCISNLTVSNYLADGENEFGIEKRPLSVTTIEEDVSIVGFFGVVGALDEETKKKLADDSEIENIKEKVNAVYDLFLDNLTVRTETDRSLIGLLAGYVNGSVTNVGIGESSIDIGENTTPLTADDVFNMQLTISAYSLIGKYDNLNVVWEDKPTGGSGGGSDVGGSGAGWGGSIDMQQLRERVMYIVGACGLTNYAISNKYGYYGFFDSYQKNIIEGTLVSSNSGTHFLEGTALPLSVDEDVLYLGGVTTGVSANDGTLVTLPYYLANTATNKEPVSSKNSGYLIGGGKRTWTSKTQFVEFKVEYVAGGSLSGKNYTVGIAKSIGTELSKTKTFPETGIHLLTNDINGNTYVITDDYNTSATTWFSQNYASGKFARYDSSTLNFSKYLAVRNDFVSQNASKLYLQGLQFNPKIDYSNIANAKINLDGISIYGTTYDDYDMIKGAINFSLYDSGIVTTIAAAMSVYPTSINQTGVASHSLFRIFKVNRTGKTIDSIEMINTIHKTVIDGEVVYLYNVDPANVQDDYELVFDFDKMSVLTETGAAYYFEIPLNKGDYAIGNITADSSKKGAHLLYLDIGANGAASDSGGDDGPTVVPAHKMTAVTFVDSAAIANKTTENYSVVTFEVNINEGVTAHGGLSMSFNRTSPTQLIYSQDDPSSAFTVTMVKDDAQLSVEKVQNMLIADLQKKRYFRRKDVAI